MTSQNFIGHSACGEGEGMKPYYENENGKLYCGDCLEIMPQLEPVDLVLTDPPYGINFMGKGWDSIGKMMINDPSGSPHARSSSVSIRRSSNPTCRNCGGLKSLNKEGSGGRKKCRCDSPDFPIINSKEGILQQEWHYKWAIEVLRLSKPGSHLMAFGGTRTYHRLACAIEDSGFEIRDTMMWVYGSGFPKSLDVSKAIDKAAGVKREIVEQRRISGGGTEYINKTNADVHQYRPNAYQKGENVIDITIPATDDAKQWDGWGTALKPAWEPIIIARRPIIGTVVENVLKHGTGALNIGECRVETKDFGERNHNGVVYGGVADGYKRHNKSSFTHKSDWKMQPQGRWPANLIHDGSDEVIGFFPDSNGQQGNVSGNEPSGVTNGIYGKFNTRVVSTARNDTGSAARFFYTAKASRRDRHKDNKHPTVKPFKLVRYLARMASRRGQLILDPFSGSGTLAVVCEHLNRRWICIEREEEYCAIAVKRIEAERRQLKLF